ncbi:hypothetical protein [Conchiformibius steedae]|uniref:Uncharacterized protein n=1 Tax=Conchiformibius steedae TaxID=153493 RepID=A0A3P2A8N9_9NEIS|nr:hypothetical protein [Conchiformibius steedae]RRD91731.1 hypothetical protein EII21_01530 [Conchiformibius steedae]
MGLTVIKVIVVDQKSKQGISGVGVKKYGDKDYTKTNKQGIVNLTTENSDIAIYVNGVTQYDGSVSECPNPLIVEK